ncbi:zinc finger CCCH domain-containing protein 65-like isoform X1 [Rosa rugosa]|uniref:zinc finger CCCH domain-containing protein 65-like isoform X1 n=1 Tax=Rosa rugosa TaxID=74645 RepID=UPI002B40AB82|nr:zinc finger CCCH domain-containing protein 65-like isoform X1 [Rosa rugosa]XP_061995365.1 zinc finger CCCH domain-containing protein 65-like isoform X1 [Rosa rugosa]XP_061995369.1 zinc finger CCCH domain-containing protein 65-like isoform X1 [Rosa rugosa]XP_061995375.1 zinc finger CCCH domain-containing protein 65-like isoform X1 [Rosa rugosa]XP_061995381.1 zinc finger CCCH domain-containing protein 65-like isoform X1 [Rosa rugosa]XP_061995386.1 zinc finger CCCH domain-containing protein 65
MEEPQIEKEKPSETLISFPPHRRRSLKSETHRTLLRILSHCYDVSQHSDQNVPPELNQDNGSNELGEATAKEGGGNVELVEPDSRKCDDSAAQQEPVADERCDGKGLRERIEQIEDFFSEEGNEELLGQMDFEDTFGINFGDLEFGPEEMLMDELEQIVKGNDDNAPKSLVENEGANDKVELLSNQEQRDDSQHNATVGPENADQAVIGEIQNEGECSECTQSLLKTSALDLEPIIQQKAMETSVSSGSAEESLIPITEVAQFEVPEHFIQKVPEAFFVFPLDTDMVGDASKPSQSKSWSQKADDLEGEHEIQPNETKMEMVCTGNAVNCPNHMNDGDMEEGEISDDDDGMDDRSTNMLLHDTARCEENKVNEFQIVNVSSQKEHSGKEAIGREFDPNSFLMSIADNVQNPRGVELRESKTKLIGRPGVVQGKTMEAIKENGYDPLLESRRIKEKDSGIGRGIGFQEACTNNQASHEKISQNYEAGSCGTTSEDKVDAGAANKRKRGHPSKEKKQRKKAKERLKRAEMNRKLGVKRLKLHSIEKPKTVVYCRHYIAGRCHEGDKCKFSHDTVPLTKSKPCCYFSRQSCMKGDDCPFDHQLSKYPCDNFVNNGSCIRGDRCLFSHKILSKEEGATAASKPELVSPTVRGNSRSAQVKIGSPSQKNSHALPHSTGTHSHNNTELIMARTLLEQPTMATKGFSFLSTGKSSLVHSSMSKQGVLAPDRNTGAKAGNPMQQSPSSSVPNTKENIMTTPPVVTPKGINFLSFGKASPDGSSGKNQDHHHSNRSVSETVQNFNGVPKVIQPAQPRAADFLSVGKAPVANSSSGNPFSLTSSSDNGNSRHFGEGKSAFDKPQNSSAISSRLQPSPLTSGQSSDYTASRFKDVVHQRSLFSTIAFAAKYESKKTNQSIGSTFTQVDRETKQNDLGKAFNILDFLSTIGSTTK